MSDTTTAPATDEDLSTIAALVKASKIAMLTTMTAEGRHESRPLAVQEEEFAGDLWFFTQDPSNKVEAIRTHPQVNASFQSNKGFVSIAGTAEIVHDRQLIDELWNPMVEAWFPEGRDDPKVALIRVRAEAAEYWHSDEPGVVAAVKGVKALITGGHPDIGENRTVGL
ncbi:MAG: pyridoxamine 5'-phosphate oxidase family protein [Salinibacterium sp.]|nr:pyridoxamine 5'-phosphate oxidase family protein [Salinibacterium sp.]MBF0671276.1 pyridoxamine 5'-phosphate oxidase family protein [Salinibacterium sp.]